MIGKPREWRPGREKTMTHRIARRQFLHTTAMAAGSLAQIVGAGGAPQLRGGDRTDRTQPIRIGSAAYTPRDYSIRGVRPTDVVLNDTFWKPKVLTNARTTIPLLAARSDGRGLSGNVLEAAIVSLQSHPDPQLQGVVQKRIAALRSQPSRGNNGFEVAVAYFQ